MKLGGSRFKPRHCMKSFDCPKGGFRIRESGNRWAMLIKGMERFIVTTKPEGNIKEIRVVRTAKRVNVQFVVEQEVDVTPSDADLQPYSIYIAEQILRHYRRIH